VLACDQPRPATTGYGQVPLGAARHLGGRVAWGRSSLPAGGIVGAACAHTRGIPASSLQSMSILSRLQIAVCSPA
jgi:hypothetical protein